MTHSSLQEGSFSQTNSENEEQWILPQVSIYEIERMLILQTLKSLLGNRTHTARSLKISIRALRYKLREYESQGFEIMSNPKYK